MLVREDGLLPPWRPSFLLKPSFRWKKDGCVVVGIESSLLWRKEDPFLVISSVIGCKDQPKGKSYTSVVLCLWR